METCMKLEVVRNRIPKEAEGEIERKSDGKRA